MFKRFYYKKSRLNQLRGFCATVQEGCSARKAAFRLGLEPTTVTIQIRSLEEDLGIKLFTRTANHRLRITEEGQAFYEMAISRLQSMDDLFESFHRDSKEKNQKTLKIAGYYSALSHILPKYIRILCEQKQFEDLKIKLCNINVKEAFDRLIKNKVDFAFYPFIENNQSTPIEIAKKNIFRLKNAVYVHKNHPLASKSKLTKNDIANHKFLVRDQYKFNDPRRVMNFKPSNIEFENSDNHIIFGLVKENLAIGGGSDIYSKEGNFINREIIFKNVDHLFPDMFYSMYTLKNKKPKDSVQFIFNEMEKDSDL